LLCLSTVCDGKFLKHVAAVKVVLQASRYGFNALAYMTQGGWKGRVRKVCIHNTGISNHFRKFDTKQKVGRPPSPKKNCLLVQHISFTAGFAPDFVSLSKVRSWKHVGCHIESL
jgi:hypothetical protein